MPGSLIVVTGTGRSGTSTMAGTLHHLGLHVPGPHLGANDSNPKGFFESKWAVRFHNDLCERAAVHIVDSRPEAFDRVQAVITPADRRALADFLAERTAGHDQTVVKDPRTTWVQRMWADVASEQGLTTSYVAMLRHPAEVVGSRLTYYSKTTGDGSPADERARRADAIVNVARWINTSLTCERETRGRTRAFVPYVDLLADWRPAMSRLGVELGLRYDVDLASGEPCAVDDFIDGDLRRNRVGWDDIDVPTELSDVAEAIWTRMLALARGEASSADLAAELDDLDVRYREIVTVAAAIDADGRAGIERLAKRAAAAAAAEERPLEQRPVADVDGRDLLRIAAKRFARKVRR